MFDTTNYLIQSVTKVDFEAQTVTDSSGSVYKYNHLVLSPGARPKKIPIPGADLKGVVTLRHVEDTKTITSSITKDSEVVLIGTSFISMEAASAVLKKGPKSVTLVGMDEVPFQGLLGKDFGLALMEVKQSFSAMTRPVLIILVAYEGARNQVSHGRPD